MTSWVITTGCCTGGCLARISASFSSPMVWPKTWTKSWTATRSSMRWRRSSSSPSSAAWASENSVSPPLGGTSRAWRTAPSDGVSRHVTSWCQPFSYPPTSADLAKRTTSGTSPLAGRNGWISSSPKRRAKAACWAEVRGWSRKNSTLYSASARATSATTSSDRSSASRIPVSSAPTVAEPRVMSKCSQVSSSSRCRSVAR